MLNILNFSPFSYNLFFEIGIPAHEVANSMVEISDFSINFMDDVLFKNLLLLINLLDFIKISQS